LKRTSPGSGFAMSRLVVFSTIIVLLWPGAVLAEPPPARSDDPDRKGFYVGAAFAGAYYKDVEDDYEKYASGNSVDVETPPGFDARVGYRLFPHLAGEIQFQWFPNADIDFDRKVATLDTMTLTGNAKFYLFTGPIQPFLLAGAGFMHFDVEDQLDLDIGDKGDSFAARFGGGVEVYFTPRIVGTLDTSYVLPTGDADGLDQVSVSLGLQYRF